MSKSMSKEMVRLIGSANKKGTSPYDTQAEVVRVEGDTAWVHIPGGVDETPVRMTMNASPGDMVQVRVSGGRAWLTGNASSPPTDNTEAYKARDTAFEAVKIAQDSEKEAERAKEAADSAESSARRAQDKAEEATASAQQAHDKAVEAEDAAEDAASSARTANRAANGALSQLSVVEDVVGTLTWISEHGNYAPTDDLEAVPGKYYFTRQVDSYNVVVSPQGNPSDQGYYELTSVDEAVSNYVASHLALTNAGLWVTNDNQSYKILLAADGMKVYDAQGNLVATFGESISFSSTRPQYIGGEDAYIIFYDSNNDGIPDAINIGGSNVSVQGDRNLSDILAACDTAQEDREYLSQHFKMDENGFTVAESLNGSETGVRVVLKGDRLSFYHGLAEVAYISDQRLYISQSVVLQQMDVGIKKTETDVHGTPGKGQWSWKVHENANGENNLYLKWLG